MNKQQLASKIWESANKMRSKIEANEYKDYILGFMFYKFLSDKEVKWLKENDWTDEYLPDLTEDDAETLDTVRKNVGYFIAYENLFSTWISKGSDFKADDVTVALQAFSRLIDPHHKKVFDGVFATLQTGLSKLGESSGARTKAIRRPTPRVRRRRPRRPGCVGRSLARRSSELTCMHRGSLCPRVGRSTAVRRARI